MPSDRTLQRMFAASVIAASLFVGAGVSPAGGEVLAWVHPVNQVQEYYMPGPPPGGYLSACIVDTTLLTETPSAVATIKPIRSSASACKPGSRAASVQIVTINPDTNQLENGPLDYSTDDWPGMSVGAPGHQLFGAHFWAINVNGYALTWDTGVI